MTDQVLRVKFVADGIGGFKADVASATGTVKQFRDTAANVGQSGAATSELSAGMASIAAETRKARADMVAFLASSQIQKLGDDWKGFGDIVAASVAGRAAFSLAEFGLATKAAIVQQNAARVAALANAAALTAEHQAKVANFIATTAAGTASAAYTAALRAEVAQSLQATVAARAHAASLSATGGAFALLGGPAGAVALAAGSLAFFALSASSAADEADKATKKNEALADSARRINTEAIAEKILADRAALDRFKATDANTPDNPLRNRLKSLLQFRIDANLATLRQAAEHAQAISDIEASVKPRKPIGKVPIDRVPPEKFKDEFTGQLKAYEDFQKTLFDVSDALNDQYAKLTLNEAEYYKYSLATKGLNKEQIDAAVALNDVNAALRASADDARKAADEGKALATVLDSIFPDEARGRKYAEDFQLLAKNLKGADLDAATTALGTKFVTDEPKKHAEELKGVYKDVADGIRVSFRDTFRDVLENGVESFQDLGSKVADVFKDTLAELASAALTKNITIAVSGASGGAAGGATQGATQGAAAGASAALPIVGAAIVIGSLFYNQAQREKEAREERQKQLEQARKDFSKLSTDILGDIRDIGSGATAGEISLRKYAQAVIDAGKAADSASLTNRAAAERTLAEAIKARYAAEKAALDDVAKSITSISDSANSLRSSVSADAKKVLGLDDFRSGSAIAASASATIGASRVPSAESFLSAKSNSDVFAKLRTDVAFLAASKSAYTRFGVMEPEREYQDRMARTQERKDRVHDVLPGLQLGTQAKAKESLIALDGLIERALRSQTLAQTEYLDNLNAFAKSASGNIDALSDLRQESLRWYDAQLKIASGLKSASQSIGGVLSSISLGQKTPGDQLKFLVDQFRNTDRSAGTGTDSQKADKLAAIGQSLVAQSGPILSLARELYASTGGYTAIEELIRATLSDQKQVIDAATPDVKNVQAETLSILGTIDTSLGSVKDKLNETLQTIKTTIGELGVQTVEALNKILTQIGDTTGTTDTVAAIAELSRVITEAAWGPKAITALEKLEGTIAALPAGAAALEAVKKVEADIANGKSAKDIIDALDKIEKAVGTIPGGKAIADAIDAIEKSISNSGVVEVTVNNTVDGVPITNAVVTTINGRLINGEQVFVAPRPVSTSPANGGQRFGGGSGM